MEFRDLQKYGYKNAEGSDFYNKDGIVIYGLHGSVDGAMIYSEGEATVPEEWMASSKDKLVATTKLSSFKQWATNLAVKTFLIMFF